MLIASPPFPLPAVPSAVIQTVVKTPLQMRFSPFRRSKSMPIANREAHSIEPATKHGFLVQSVLSNHFGAKHVDRRFQPRIVRIRTRARKS